MGKLEDNTNPHAEAIRQLHRLGRRVRELDDQVGLRGPGGRRWGSVKQLSAELGVSPSTLHVARTFHRQYPEKRRLNWLCKLGTRSGKPLSPSQIMRLTTVDDQQLRDGLAERCAVEEWSVIRLEQEIHALRGKRPYGGRRPSRPADQVAALRQLSRMSGSWLRWMDQFCSAEAVGVSLSDLPPQLRKQLLSVQGEMVELERLVETQLRRRRHVRHAKQA